MMSPSQIIEALGGHRRVADITGVPPSVAHKWRIRGIPARYWPDVAAYAAEAGLRDISIDTLKRPMWQRSPEHA
jgi:hypothetical protein